MKPFIVVYNARSGQKRTKADLEKIFHDADVKPQTYIPVSPRLRQKLQPYIKKAFTIAVVGGDGTVSNIAGMVRGTSAVLAPLPGGTLNHFADDVGVPADFNDAVARLKTAKMQKVDVASINGKSFINNSSIGIYPASLRARSRFEDRFGKWPAAIIGSVRALLRFRTYKITLNDHTISSPYVFIGNNKYSLSTAGIPERHSVDQGVLTVHVARAHSRWQLCVLFLRTLIGRARDVQNLDVYTVNDHFVIETSHATIHISRDGEVEKTNGRRLEYRIHRQALRVLR